LLAKAPRGAGEQIRTAGTAAAKLVVDQTAEQLASMHGAVRAAKIAAWVSGVCAGGAGLLVAFAWWVALKQRMSE
jgi:hypothetical protein